MLSSLVEIGLVKNRFGGRPKLPRQEVRDQRVVTFLTVDERTHLERIAEDANVSVSRACHGLIVGSMERLGILRPGAAVKKRSK
jgi:hypothetical protein